MDNLVSLVFEKGLLFAIAVAGVGLVVYFIKKENDRRDKQFENFESKMNLWEEGISSSSSTLKTALTTSHLDARQLHIQIEGFQNQLAEFKTSITKEMLNLRAHSSQIHERSENIKKSIDEVLGKVKVIETNQQQYDVVFKKLINKAKT